MFPLAYIVSHPDVFAGVADFLEVKDIAHTRLVSKMWHEEGKVAVKIYQVGMGSDGWSKWDEDADKTNGWGMMISIDFRGIIKGANKNNGAHSHTAQLKQYKGLKENGTMNIDVRFPDTDQLNTYTGSIEGEIWTGSFKLIKSCGSRQQGSTGKSWGKVLEC